MRVQIGLIWFTMRTSDGSEEPGPVGRNVVYVVRLLHAVEWISGVITEVTGKSQRTIRIRKRKLTARGGGASVPNISIRSV
jgi:hypothetical protein